MFAIIVVFRKIDYLQFDYFNNLKVYDYFNILKFIIFVSSFLRTLHFLSRKQVGLFSLECVANVCHYCELLLNGICKMLVS